MARNERRVESRAESRADLAANPNGVPASMGVELPGLRRIVQGVRGNGPVSVLRRLAKRAPLISARPCSGKVVEACQVANSARKRFT